MRSLMALILFGLAAWRGYADYQQTAANGEAYSMSSIDTVWSRVSPGSYETYLPRLQESEVPLLWDPAVSTLLTFPAAVVLLVLAVFFFIIRRKAEEA